MNYYISRRDKFTQEHNSLKAKFNNISVGRLIAALLFVVICYYAIIEGSFSGYGIAMAVCAAIFLYLMRLHTTIGKQKERSEALISVNEDEIQHLERKGSNYYDGSEFADTRHPYTHDLDIFGRASLYQHLNRTETFKGSHALAALLQSPLSVDEIYANQEAIKELTAKADWRQEIQALGRMKKDSSASYSKLMQWLHKEQKEIDVISKVIAWAGPAALVGSFILYLISGEGQYLTACTYIFAFNLSATLNKLSLIKNEIAHTTEVDEILQQYSRIIEQVENEEFISAKLKSLQSKLGANNKGAGILLKKLAKLFGQMDSAANMVVAILFNGLFQYHLHVIAALQKWKANNDTSVPEWLNVIAEVEALNSLANFAYNNPTYAYPVLNNYNKVVFKDVAHPLLNPETRIGNDIDFNPGFTILTGSNMSGKSTFLRSLGVNMVLAGAGAPVCAAEATIQPMPVLVSMRLSDSLSDSESYFFAEIKRLKQIMDLLQDNKCFVLLDEILRGTNSDDKRTGTVGVIEKMTRLNAIGAIATHDIEVCNTADKYPDSLINRCFEVEIIDNELYFDYKLRDGICKNKSATFLMEKNGVI